MPLFGRTTRLILLSAFLAMASFLIGQNWSVVTSYAGSLQSKIPLDGAVMEEIVENNQLYAGLVFAAISASIVPASVAILGIIKYARRRSIIELMFDKEDAVHIVASHLSIKTFDTLYAAKTMSIPANAPLLPSHTAMSIGVLSNFARVCYGDRKPVRLHFDNENWGSQEHSFISVGGPFTNRLAKDLLEEGRVPGLSIGDPLSFIDGKNEFSALRASEKDDAPVTKDYGVLIFIKNPHDKTKYCILIFGLWPQGALATMTLLLNPKSKLSKFEAQVRKNIKQGISMVAVVEVNVNNLVFDEIKLVKLRNL